MIYSREVEEMCPVAQGVHHGLSLIHIFRERKAYEKNIGKYNKNKKRTGNFL